MVQLFVYTPLITGLATRQNSPSLRNGSRHGEKAQSKIYQLLFMWRIEHEELQKQKIREQPGFVPPSRLGTNQSERIARSGYGDQRAHSSQTSKIQCCITLAMETELILSCELSSPSHFHTPFWALPRSGSPQTMPCMSLVVKCYARLRVYVSIYGHSQIAVLSLRCAARNSTVACAAVQYAVRTSRRLAPCFAVLHTPKK